MGPKRSHSDMESNASSPLLPMFEQFRAELDEHHNRRERIIKASRDITAASKKIIFTLQRVRQLAQPLPQHVVKGNLPYYDTITTQFAAVSRDLQQMNSFRYARQLSGGCQEYIEAASFEHYLTTAKLLTYDEAVEKMRGLDPEGTGVLLSFEDYLLGIYDMTGELMRFAITSMATSGSLPALAAHSDDATMTPADDDDDDDDDDNNAGEAPRNVLTDMRVLRSALEALNAGFGPFAKDVEKKMEVMQTSVEKVERALYGLVVRGAERPKGWMPSTESARPLEVEG